MSRIEWIIILLLLTSLSILGGHKIFIQWQGEQNLQTAQLLSDITKSYVSPELTHNGIVYWETAPGQLSKRVGQQWSPTTVDDVTLLSLLKLKYLNLFLRYQPLAALPGTDLEAYVQTIEQLERGAVATAQYYPATWRSKIDKNFHATDVMREVAALEMLRRQLVYAPDTADISVYLDQLDATLSRLAGAIAAYQEIFSDIQNDDSFDSRYHFVDGVLSYDSLVDGFLDLQEQVRVQQITVARLRACLLEGSLDCDPITISANTESVGLHLPSIEIEDLSEEQEYLEALTKYYQAYDRSSINAMIDASLYVLNNSTCFGSSTPSVFALLDRTDDDGVITSKILYLNEPFIRETGVVATSTWSLEQPGGNRSFIGRRGLAYLWQPANNSYMCLTSPTDLARVQTMRYLSQLSREVPVFSRFKDSDDAILRQLAQSEFSLGQTKELRYEHDYQNFIDLITNFLQSQGHHALAAQIGVDGVLQLEHERLLWWTQSAFYDRQLSVLSVENTAIYNTVERLNRISVGQLWIHRSDFFSILSVANKSWYPSSVTFLERRPFEPSSFRWLLFSEAEKRYPTLTYETLPELIRSTYDMIGIYELKHLITPETVR